MTTARSFIGAGEVYINRTDSGTPTGLLGPYYASKFEIKPNVKKLPLKSFARATYGQSLLDVSVQEPASLSIALSEVDKTAMGLALMGTSAASNQSSGTLTAEVITAKLGVWVKLSKGSLTGSPTVTNSSVSTTYVLGTDYEVNAQMGWVRAIVGGAITADQALKVTTTYGAFTGTKIAGVTLTELRAEIIFVGINLVDRTPCIVTARDVSIAVDAAYDFLNSDFGPVVLPGILNTPAGQTESFTVELRSA